MMRMKFKKDYKSILHAKTPSKCNVSSADFYLHKRVDIRLRFDLAPAKLIINLYDGIDYSYIVHYIVLSYGHKKTFLIRQLC